MSVLENTWSVPPPPWEDLWQRHRGDVLRYTTHLLDGDVHAAEDICQEVGVRLWQRRDLLSTSQPLGPWLRTVARHLVVDRHRRRQARPTEVPSVADGEPVAALPEAEVGSGMESAESVAAILATLSDGHRAAVREVYVNDRAVRDAADVLGIPVGTVKSRCHVALRRLRETAAPPRCA